MANTIAIDALLERCSVMPPEETILFNAASDSNDYWTDFDQCVATFSLKKLALYLNLQPGDVFEVAKEFPGEYVIDGAKIENDWFTRDVRVTNTAFFAVLGRITSMTNLHEQISGATQKEETTNEA